MHKKQKDFLKILPSEMIFEILSFLTTKELNNFSLVNKKWIPSVVSRGDPIWKQKYLHLCTILDLPHSEKEARESNKTSYKRKCFELLNHHNFLSRSYIGYMPKKVKKFSKESVGNLLKDGGKIKVYFLSTNGATTSMLLLQVVNEYGKNNFHEEGAYIPTVFGDNVSIEFSCKDKKKKFEIEVSQMFNIMRPLSWGGNPDVVVFCYDVEDKNSYEDILMTYSNEIPLTTCRVLVCSGIEKRGKKKKVVEEGKVMFSREDGVKLGKKIAADFVVEVSSKLNINCGKGRKFIKLIALAYYLHSQKVFF